MYTNGFLGSFKNYECEFLPLIESEERYKENLLSQPDNWEYRTKTIQYKYNSLGHRCGELDELPNDYILTAGCSFTEGVGLKLEDTYSYLLAKKFNMGYYNLGVGGSAPSVTVKNVISFLGCLGDRLPQLIVLQWPFFQRYHIISPELWLEHHNTSNIENKLYKALLENDNAFRYNISERLYLLHYLKNIKYPGYVVEFFNQNQKELENITRLDNASNFSNTYQTVVPHMIDFARDLSHPGSITNKLYSDKIIKILSSSL